MQYHELPDEICISSSLSDEIFPKMNHFNLITNITSIVYLEYEIMDNVVKVYKFNKM